MTIEQKVTALAEAIVLLVEASKQETISGYNAKTAESLAKALAALAP